MRQNMTFRDVIRQQALEGRRKMLRDGELLCESDFRERLRVSGWQLARMVASGSVFTIEVDGGQYFPSLLVTPGLDRKRLQSVCRILVPAPPECRLDYLESRQGNLGDISPLEALHDEKSYRWMRQMARAWAAEWSRTAATIYLGRHREVPAGIEPLVTAMQDFDPRINLWTRAASTLREPGYLRPDGPYPQANLATVFVTRYPAGGARAIAEARVTVSIANGFARARAVCGVEPGYNLDPAPVGMDDSIVDAVSRLFIVAAKRRLASQARSRPDPAH
ncbi:hypothetical protein [Paraburkholderia elongata]|uniref:hypothetical protein n=1 Tax=Paraburkholderia elongata TaxID=2675747 RepID=UPI001556C534|nr:hypothetical protein [Paraburkholderia elongata]